MHRTKKAQTSPRSRPERSPVLLNGPSCEVLTLAEAAAFLRLPETDVVHLVHSQGLPARCVADEWRFLKAAIENWLATGSPTWETRKASILELAGKYREDPDLEEVVNEAYRRRARPTTKRDI